ncbi:MAG: HAMP domain-containing protein [Proteobacteria bacterium]|nr:HAMP domain-containing protein [Pseudomonadota bacterium]
MAQKLWLGFGLLLLIMVVSSLVSIHHIRQIDRALRQVVEIEKPLEDTVLEMEINAGAIAREVLSYVHKLETKHLEVMRDSDADFERFAARFEQLAETDEVRRLGRKVAGLYAKFKMVGDEIIVLADQRESALQAFRTSAEAVDGLLDGKLKPLAAGNASSGTGKLKAAADLDEFIDKTFAPMEPRLRHGDQTLLRQALLGTQAKFDGLVARYRENGLSAEETGLLDRIEQGFNDAMESAIQIMEIVHRLDLRLDDLEENLVAMKSALHDEIQPLIHAETAKAANRAQASTDAASVSLLVLGVIASMFGGATAWGMSRTIVRPIRALVAGAKTVGGGDLDHRIVIESKDEFGHLAIAFNRMVENLSRAKQSIEGGRQQLEQNVKELAKANASLESHTEELARSNAELEQFAYVASHDLQEPLRKVQAFGDRMVTQYASVLDERGLDYLNRMRDAANRMQTLVENLLEFSRIASKGQSFVPVDLAQVAREVASDLEIRIQETETLLEIGDLPTIHADPLQMRQLLQNLIANALKYRRKDTSHTVRLKGGIVEDWGSYRNDTPAQICQILVKDNGIGFEEKYAERIFGIFQRLHGRSEFEGTGVGLAICRKICERHGGTITAEGRPGDGATFIVTLPINHANSEAA